MTTKKTTSYYPKDSFTTFKIDDSSLIPPKPIAPKGKSTRSRK